MQDLFNYFMDFTSRNIQNFHLTFFVIEREILNYKKEYYPAEVLACPYNVPAQKKCWTCSGYPALGYCTTFLVHTSVARALHGLAEPHELSQK